MESLINENPLNQAEQNQDVKNTESAENFQKFIYELFDKSGILTDLRAYLRGHIVNVLKTAQTGDSSACQKHFTQRLDPTFQALNMLVAEYLLCLEFNYSLSVFVSEIPLANMVFGYAKTLMDLGADGEATGLRFPDSDVWSILNYLGVKCDSVHANKIMEMYKTQVKSPLLSCILKSVQLYDGEKLYSVSSQEGSMSTSSKSSNTKRKRSLAYAHCKHSAFCKSCHSRIRQIKEKYKKKTKCYIQKSQASIYAMNVDKLMKNIGAMERSLIDEMFEQLKTVYEAEIDMFKTEHEGKIKTTLASEVERFKKMQNELEESFKAREVALETAIVSKKRFLWGLAQALRLQHSQMTRAMQGVKKQTAILREQELSLKQQRTEAEESLKKHAEEMRQQIADELVALERHLESMKTERDTINRERIHLDEVNTENKITGAEVKNYLQKHYNLLKEELGVLKKNIENATFHPKHVVEQSTITEDKETMNNETARGLVREEVRPNQVVNDLKKQKNVNFSQCQSEVESRGSRSGSSSSEDLCRMLGENEHLRNLARQQTPITRLSTQARLQPDLYPHIAPATAPRLERSMRESNEFGWRAGAGEEHGLMARARVLVPGDMLPFVGVVGRHSDSRRHLLNRWRALRRRVSPLAADLASRSAAMERPAESVSVRIHSPSSDPTPGRDKTREQEKSVRTPTRDVVRPKVTTESQKTREKSPRSVLKEAKEKLKTVTRASASREKSPSAILREAKQRLRKLEIEAEAVERSYMDFRRRRELRHPDRADESCIPRLVSNPETRRRKETPGHSKSDVRATDDAINFDLDKYFKKYKIDLETMEQDHFKNNNATAGLKSPVPKAYSEIDRNEEPIPKHDYLEEPISEFRKLYYVNQVRIRANTPVYDNFQEPSTLSNINCETALKEKCSEIRNEKNNKMKELEILKQNITKIYDLQDEPTKETQETTKQPEDTNVVENLLTVEVETVSEVRDLHVESSETDVLVVVKGSVDTQDISPDSESNKDQMSTNMTIVITPKKIDVKEDTNERATIESSPSLSPVRVHIIHSNISTEFYEASGDKVKNDVQTEIRNDPDSELQLDARSPQISENEEAPDDYPDDFSYDVDNYKSEYDNSPISLAKTSEDENFWD